MRRPSSLTHAIVLLAMMGCANGYAACTPSGNTICQWACDCNEPCPQPMLATCKADAASDEQASELLGCSKQYDDLVACKAKTGLCTDGLYVVKCTVPQKLWNTCMEDAQKP